MESVPKSQKEADRLLERINSNPLFQGRLAAKDGSLTGIYLPLNQGKKDRSYYLSQQVRSIVQKHLGSEENFYIAGLPVAETTFGSEMFIQMGVYAPAAGLVIFILLFIFFRNLKMIAAPMMLAMMVVISSMGALIYAGEAIHIMSSMIPIFLMPIAVLDSVHILSTLHDSIQRFQKREDAVRHVMKELYSPMLFTSVTTMVGFASLATTGIPPVVVFGVTIAFGVFLAWFWSMTFIPAYAMLLSEKTLRNFGRNEGDKKSYVMEVVQMFRGISNRAPHVVIIAAILTFGVSIYGIQKIVVNDNPVRWFKKSHEIRKADSIMNQKTAGTYLSNLYFFIPKDETNLENEEVESDESDPFAEDEFADDSTGSGVVHPSIRDPEVIAYMEKVSNFLIQLGDGSGNRVVGDATSIVDILKKVGDVAFQDSTLPDTKEKISQYMFLFESGDSNKGRDMWKFITPGEENAAQLWIQFKTGDNQNLDFVMEKLEEFKRNNPPPKYTLASGETVQLQMQWSGLTYINKVWQDEMVSGMTYALAGSFVIVLIMMIFLFRSVSWGIIAMLPLTLTIAMIYGLIGFSGKFFDMPIAVLSSLTLGLSIDFSIHFIQSIRQINNKSKNVETSLALIYGETSQAIWRNVLVVSIGFSPLFLASLVPYVTVGYFFFGIMVVSGVTTLILLPTIVKLFHRRLPGF